MNRLDRRTGWLVRLVALLAAFVLVGQSLLGSVQLCALVEAVSSDCCESASADESREHTATEEHAGSSAVETDHGLSGGCSCPFDCALGCCSTARAVLPQVALVDVRWGDSEELSLSRPEQDPPSPDARGILHVPKRTV